MVLQIQYTSMYGKPLSCKHSVVYSNFTNNAVK